MYTASPAWLVSTASNCTRVLKIEFLAKSTVG
jgi:hypothetical protein